MRITYQVSVEPPREHKIRVRLELEELAAGDVDLVLPSWVPGSYEISDYSKRVGPLLARSPDGGAPLPLVLVDKSRWRIVTGGSPAVVVEYWVSAYLLITEGLDLTEEHLFLNPGLCLPYVDGQRDTPYDVVLHLPAGWTVHTELARLGQSPVRLRAQNYDELVDSPIDCGNPTVIPFHAKDAAHEIVLCGTGGNFEPHRLEEDLRRIVEATQAVFGSTPYAHYTFFCHLADFRDGGLEHATSNSVVIPRSSFRPASSYRKFLALASHEFVHTYLVKGVRPSALIPFDYTREMHTRLLWAMEGVTDYYGWLVLRRSDLLPPARSLESLAEVAGRYLELPARRVQSLEESSWLTWTGNHYRPTENTPNRTISYYDKGLLVAWALDLELRERTDGRASLDDVVRRLWTHFRTTGIPEDGMPTAIRDATGVDASAFFDRYVSGTDELDLDACARRVGLTFGAKPDPREPDGDPPPGYLGVHHRAARGRVQVTSVLDDTPSRRAGLAPGDEFVAINGERVTDQDFEETLGRLTAGETIQVTVFRRGWLTTLPLVVGARSPRAYAFRPWVEAPERARGAYRAWFGADWVAPKPDAAKD